MLQTAQRSLSRRDPVLRKVIRAVGDCSLEPRKDLFDALVHSIIAQQISTKAASSIRARLQTEICKGKLTPHVIAALTEEELRPAGLSLAKAKSIRHLAQEVSSKRLNLKKLSDLEDQEVIEALITVRGIGPWTAQMFLIFSLGRLDVLPVADLGLRNAAMKLYDLKELPGPDSLEDLAKKWRPYCSVATWYLWRSLELS